MYQKEQNIKTIVKFLFSISSIVVKSSKRLNLLIQSKKPLKLGTGG